MSLLLLTLLAGIAAALFTVQSRYDPNQWQERAQPQATGSGERPDRAAADEAPSARPADPALPGFKPLTPPEHYDAATLSDKINGKAELYLTAGFLALQTRRLAPEGAPGGVFLEQYVYDMGRRRNAFAVFSSQRRPARQTLDLTPEAYRAANGVFMVHGRYYVEIIASEASESLGRATQELARRFVAQTPVPDEPAIEAALFPEAERVPDSISLIAANAFGLEGLDWIYTTPYRRESNEALAFLARRASAAEADQARDAFAAYFLEYGGEPVEVPANLNTARMIAILDTYEIVMTHGPFLFGVHEAADRDQAVELTARLLERVREAHP